jgi:hypothetical protein
VLSPRHRHGTLTRGLVAGALAAAATAGALLGFGIRQGTPARPFNAIASLILGDRAVAIWGFHLGVTVVGVLAHVAVTLAWAVLFARLARGKRPLNVAGAALLVTILALLVNVFLVGRVAGERIADVLAPGHVVALHMVFGVALVVGMRFAIAHVPE